MDWRAMPETWSVSLTVTGGAKLDRGGGGGAGWASPGFHSNDNSPDKKSRNGHHILSEAA